jgi:hypothetical protein
MARTDTLGNFLTDVAEAIRNKTGKTDKLTPASFDTEIEGTTGGELPNGVLPAGYTQVEFITSDGTQRIDTGFKPTEKTNFEITFASQNAYVASGDFGSIFGTRYTYNADGYHLGTFDSRDGLETNSGCFIFGSTFYTGFMKNDGSKQTVKLEDGIYTGGKGTTKDLSNLKNCLTSLLRPQPMMLCSWNC